MKFTEEDILAQVRKAYREGTARFEIEARRSALLVIDVQDEFVRPGWRVMTSEEILAQIR